MIRDDLNNYLKYLEIDAHVNGRLKNIARQGVHSDNYF